MINASSTINYAIIFLQDTLAVSRSAAGVFDGTACVTGNNASGKTLTGKFCNNLYIRFRLNTSESHVAN